MHDSLLNWLFIIFQKTQFSIQSPSEHFRREGSSVGNKQEMKVGVAVVPRKGLISLSTNGEPEQLPDIAGLSFISL